MRLCRLGVKLRGGCLSLGYPSEDELSVASAHAALFWRTGPSAGTHPIELVISSQEIPGGSVQGAQNPRRAISGVRRRRRDNFPFVPIFDDDLPPPCHCWRPSFDNDILPSDLAIQPAPSLRVEQSRHACLESSVERPASSSRTRVPVLPLDCHLRRKQARAGVATQARPSAFATQSSPLLARQQLPSPQRCYEHGVSTSPASHNGLLPPYKVNQPSLRHGQCSGGRLETVRPGESAN